MMISIATLFLRKGILLFVSLFFVCILSLSNTQVALAANSSELNDSNQTIIEYLRLRVPHKDRNAWLIAEQKSWEPWLKEQKGFLGRQLLWDAEREEAILLISWASRSDWKTIPQEEIDHVQKTFEEIATDLTGKNGINPFPIKSQGELFPQ